MLLRAQKHKCWKLYAQASTPPSLYHKAASDKMLQTIEAHPNWPVYADVFKHPPPRLASWCPIWSDMTHNCAVERGLAVDFCGQLHHCNWSYYPAAWFRSPSSVMVSFSDRSRSMPCNFTQMGSCQITNTRLWPAADYEPYRGRVSVDKVWWRTTTTSWSWRWRSQVTGIYSDYSTREMNKLLHYINVKYHSANVSCLKPAIQHTCK